jgi:GH24 family phage-related lysozyme (muramidase)
MKIKPNHYAFMNDAIQKVLTDNPNAVVNYQSGNFPNSDKVKNLQKRFCYDLAYAAGLSRFFCSTLYEYANDDHIYTALRNICPRIT